jgi:hypothetical protein
MVHCLFVEYRLVHGPLMLLMEREILDESFCDAYVSHEPSTSSTSGSKRSPIIKQAKDDLGNGKKCEQTKCVQAQSSLEKTRALSCDSCMV